MQRRMASEEPTNPALRELSQELRKLLAAPMDARRRHAIGRLVYRARCGQDKYGAGAVVKLAAAAGEDVASLYRYAAIAQCWPIDDVEALLRPHDGYALSWSHLVLLSSVVDADERQRLTHMCRTEHWTIRELRRQIVAGCPKRSAKERVTQLEGAVRAAERLIRDDLGLDDLPVPLLTRALEVYEHLRSVADTQVRELRRLLTDEGDARGPGLPPRQLARTVSHASRPARDDSG
jgi:hypothetical protein